MKLFPLLFLTLIGLVVCLLLSMQNEATESSQVTGSSAQELSQVDPGFAPSSFSRQSVLLDSSAVTESLNERWQVIKPMLLQRKTRSVGLALAMEMRGIPSFFLGRIQIDMEKNQEFANPFGHLLAVILEGWPQIPGETDRSLALFLPQIFAEAEHSEHVCDVAARAWKNRRILETGDLDLVLGIRPMPVDTSPLSARITFFLLALEDVFHAFMEAGDSGRVERFLTDPSQKVRLVAIRVLFEGKSSAEWANIMALLEGMSPEDVIGLAEWIADTQDPQIAAELLRMIASSMETTGGFLSAWARLGRRDLRVLEWTLRSEFDQLTVEQTAEPNSGFIPIENVGELDFLYHEGALRKEVMDAYFLNALSKGEPMDAEMLNWLARLDQNPLTRGQAWRTLGRSPDDANLALTLGLFAQPGYLATLRLPGEESDQRAAEFLIQYVSPRLDANERSLVLAQSQEMLLSEAEREAFQKAFSD
ncbi:MAG: hypothetical protein QM477_03150 [Planctomycetota bacterium]